MQLSDFTYSAIQTLCRQGDVHYKMNPFEKAFKCFFNAVQCPKGLGNPYIHLRLGQIYYGQKNLEKADLLQIKKPC